MLAVALLSASGVIISVASIVRFMRAGHSSISRVLASAVRLLALATACLFPAAIALHTGSEGVAIVTAVLAIAAYYFVVLRTAAGSRLLRLGVDGPASGASA